MRIFLTVIYTFMSCILIQAQDNPFLPWAKQKYADYSEDLYNQSLLITINDTIAGRKIVNQIKETARKAGSVEWQLQAEYFELAICSRKYVLYGDSRYTPEEILKWQYRLLEKAEKAKVIYLALILRQQIIQYHWWSKNYELAFELYDIQNELLKEVTADDVPERADYFVKSGNAYYDFKDYERAAYCFNMVLEQKMTIRAPNARQHARNGLGLVYRYAYNDLDRSDSYYYAIKQSVIDECTDKVEWNGIADSHLGYNMFLRGAYAKAIPLLKSGLEQAIRYKDIAFAVIPAIHLARTYLKTGDIPLAKHYIDLALDLHQKRSSEGKIALIYEALSKYYAATGNASLSMAYMDSTVAENKRREEQFNALQMMRVEQRKHLSEQRLKEEQLKEEQIKTTGYRRSLLITIIALLLIGGASVRYYILYRKKQAAYRELVRKSQDWAQTSVNNIVLEHSVNDEDKKVFHQFQQLVQSEHLYRSNRISIEKIASRINSNRTYLSRAINKCTGKNFSSYMNELRIKDAILRISDHSEKLSFEGIAFEVGFNDRKTFYSAFKKITGLSPLAFRDNMQKQ